MPPFLRLLIQLLAIGLAVPALDCGSPVLARKKSKIVTRNFSSGESIEVPDVPNLEGSADPFPATLGVGGFRKGKIRDVELTLHRMQHGKFHDIDVLLVAPN